MSNKQPRYSGKFWFSDEPGHVIPGYLDLSGKRPRVELLGALSKFIEEVPSVAKGVRKFASSNPSPNERTIHGEIIGPSRRVTLLRVRSRSYKTPTMNPLSLLRGQGLEEETIDGTHAVLGAHLGGRDANFNEAMFRLAGQDAWAHLSGLEMQHTIDGSEKGRITFTHQLPERLSTKLPNELGSLCIVPEATVSPPRIAGAYILTSTWFSVENKMGMTLDTLTERYVTPTSALLTILYIRECPPVGIRIKDPESGRWCDVFSPGLADDPTDVHSPKIEDPPLLSREDLGLDRLAMWLQLVERVTPLPQLVAGAIETGTRTVQNLLLELATAAEGVHRKLHPDSQRLGERARAEALEAISAMDTDPKARSILHDAMRTYLWDLSFPMRLKELANEVAGAMPGVTGRTSRWSSAVVDARNGFAHWLAGASSEDKIFAYHVLYQSLRWLLTCRLLLESGVPSDVLASRLAEFEPYRQFLREAKRTLPRIYPPQDQ